MMTLLVTAVLTLTAIDATGTDSVDDSVDRSRVYQVTYTVTPKPDRGGVTVELRVRQARRLPFPSGNRVTD